MILNIRDIGGAGLNSDIAPWDLPLNALSYGRNFRIRSGKIQSSGGSTVGFDADTAGRIGHVAYTEDYTGSRVWIACTTAGIEYYDGAAWQMGLAIADSEPEQWSSCRIGQVLFLNHPNHYPVYLENASGSNINTLPWMPGEDSWDGICKAKVLCSHKNFLFALGTTEIPDARAAFSSYDDRVRWSHPVEPNGRPYTWTDASNDPSSLAGYVTLGRGGMIIGGESLRDSFVIYSDYAINVMDYTGGALMWRRRTVSQSAGLVSKEAVVEVNGAHFFISKDDILMFDGNQVTSMLHNRLRRSFQSVLDDSEADTSFAVRNDTQNEIYFCLPERRDDIAGDKRPNIAFVFNYRDNNWSIREMDTERQYSHSCFGDAPDLPNPWEDAPTKWNTERQTWQGIGKTPFGSFLLASSGTKLYNIDTQSPDNDIVTKIERTDIPVGGHDNVTTITRVYPHIEGSFPVDIWVGSQQHAGDSVLWKGPVRFNPGKDRKVDIRVTGELHAIRMEAAAEGNFNITGCDVEYSPAGTR